ncbi:MAG: hypothetical protein M3421_08495, partial [Bacteroidota bacterium]|nr:hypothetical protein [Bacteroidota bacterium]
VESLQAHKQTIHIDGATDEDIWQVPFPVFIGHKSETHASSQVTYDDEYLYVISSIWDKKAVYDLPDIEDNDGLSI